MLLQRLMRVFLLFSCAITSVAGANDDVEFVDGFEGEGIVRNCGLPPAGTPGQCGVSVGKSGLLIRAHAATPVNLLKNAELLIDSEGAIACVGCDCSQAPAYSDATVLNCPDVLATPGFINSHEHLTFPSAPATHGAERFDHRHDWRRGLRGHSQLSTSSDASVEGTTWAEIRHMISGTTSIIGSGRALGFLRNLDRSADRLGLNGPTVDTDTFPMGDTSGQLIETGCGYPDIPVPRSDEVFQAHFSEGVDNAARNEWVCASASVVGAFDPGLPGPSLVHATGLTAQDAQGLAQADATVVWSPRSDIGLYGMTTPVTTMDNAGVNIALGTNWVPTGSMNLLRELSCTTQYNQSALNGHFEDWELLAMVTSAAASAAGVSAEIGGLAVGLQADLTLFDASVREGYVAALEATPADIVLVTRSGVPLYGDGDTLEVLGYGDESCELMGSVVSGDCLSDKRLCVTREGSDNALTYALLQADSKDRYPLYFCDNNPLDEPSCIPARNEGDGIVYTGIGTESDVDGDGVADGSDNCPAIFNPPRPVDGFAQADQDGDGQGDECDATPLL